MEYIRRILKELIQCDSQSKNNDDKKITELIKKYCEELEMTVEIIPMKSNPKKNNIIAYWKKENNKIILSSHFDTVPIGNINEWKYGPFSGEETIENNLHYIYGRGASDMKGGLVSQLQVLKELHEKNCKIKDNILLIVTSEEEDGVLGANDLLKQRPEIMNSAELIIVGEPTSCDVGISEKGELRLHIECFGISAHGSSPHLGLNAIEGMFLLFQHMKYHVPLTTDFSNQTTITIGTIKGGTSANIVPDYCECELDIRICSYLTVDEVLDIISKIVKNVEKVTQFKYKITEESRINSVSTDIDNHFVQQLYKSICKIHSKCKIKRMAYGTDASILSKTKNQPNVIIFGPGSECIIHKPDEFVILENIKITSDGLSSFLQELQL